MLLWYVARHHSGSLLDFYNSYQSLSNTLHKVVWDQWRGSWFSLSVISGYLVWAILVTLYLPGETYYGPVTDKGNRPEYVNNGFRFYLITLTAFIGLAVYLELATSYSVTVICDRYGEFMFIINLLSLLFCLFLYFKGIFIWFLDCGLVLNDLKNWSIWI
jgi:7-dehydrocholesterol reductase